MITAYQQYTDSAISDFDEQVANYLGLGGGTIIGENYMISPIIGGGYLNITSTDNKCVIIDPNNLTSKDEIIYEFKKEVYEIELKEVVTAIDKWEADTMRRYAANHYPGLDTLSSHFYFKKLNDILRSLEVAR